MTVEMAALADELLGTAQLNLEQQINKLGATALAIKSERDRLKTENNKLRRALYSLDRMSRGLDWCDSEEQARRWAEARRLAGDIHEGI